MLHQVIRIGNGAGFWGDNLDAPWILARDGGLDVLTLEYLAELTMSILAHLRSKDPRQGYVRDFPEALEKLGPILQDQPGLSIVTNAGGLNPGECARACAQQLTKIGLEETVVGAVDGDDVLSRLLTWHRDGVDLAHFETGEPIDAVLPRLVAANAYLGARPIVEALRSGARIVVTGRVADASLTVAPAVARFGWSWDDWSKLAAASVAGHLIECGAQATGGLFDDWSSVENPAEVGYPIAEIDSAGGLVVTKPEGSGGIVSVATLSEQIVYEIDDPSCYRTPDVDVDLTQLRLEQLSTDRIKVSGAGGRSPSDRLKVSAVYRDGWTATGMLAVVGRDAEAKARRGGEIVKRRVERAGFVLDDLLVECIGAGDVVPGVLKPGSAPIEVVLRITARDSRREAIDRLCREFAPLITSGPAGFAGYATGRPEPRPAFGYWPFLLPRSLVSESTVVRSARRWLEP